MKRIFLSLLLAFATAAHGASPDAAAPLADLKPAQQQAQAAHLTAEILARYHYKAMPLDDALSEKIFDQYLKSLDPDRLIFIRADIERLGPVRTRLDDAILGENLGAPFAIFNLYMRRSAERIEYSRKLLEQGFEFAQNESYQYDRAKEAWPASEPEMRDLWRRQVKNDWLRLKLAGKDARGIAETLDKRYSNGLRHLRRMTSEDAFMTFMNAYTTAIEPHTNYLGPRAAEDFNISMKLALVGIGAVLAERDDYTTIRELVAGGPAALSGQLKAGDRILGVAQGTTGTMTDVAGWRLDETVMLIRGEADSIVSLDVLPADAGPDGKRKLVSLQRKKITLEDQAAKKSVLSVPDGKTVRHIGVISLPSFYEDFDGRRAGRRDFKSASRDVARLLEELKREKVDSVLIDLRNNGGGSLREAVELTGLFIDRGPVVQQRSASGELVVSEDTDPGTAWDGPLGVLINRGSASASEIFAAAIQDYGRGVIIGEPSFGKGTVQSMIDLDAIANSDKPRFGELKLTVAQFFRINGGTTQLRGVTPDIPLPATSNAEKFGESSFDNALPWVQVKAANYSPSGALKARLSVLLAQHEARVRKDRDFQSLQEDIAEINLQRGKNSISLNEAERRRERDAQEARALAREARKTADQGSTKDGMTRESVASLRDDGLQANERTLASELVAEKNRKSAKDVFLDEAANILGDEVGLLAGRGR